MKNINSDEKKMDKNEKKCRRTGRRWSMKI